MNTASLRSRKKIILAFGFGLLLLWRGTPAGWSLTADLILGEPGSTLTAMAGQTRILQTSAKITRVTMGDPKVVDVQIMDPNRLILLGKAPGATDLSLWDEANQMLHYRVEVNLDLGSLQRDLNTLFPGAKLTVMHTQGVYVLTGTLSTTEQAERVQLLLTQITEQMKVKFLNMARLSGVQQVQLKVRIAEINRAAIRQLGINAVKLGEDFFGALLTGSASGGALIQASTLTPQKAETAVSPLVTLLAGFPNSDLELFIEAMAENQYLKVLAEPTLIALSGEKAQFHSGGEFPIPVPQSGSGDTVTITIDYKKYGVDLVFLPTVLGEGAIRMSVAPEVSELSDVGAVQEQGFRIPAILTRRAETTLEMRSGQTFAIAGLLSQNNRSHSSRIPVFGSIPLVGALFRTVNSEVVDTELLVLVKADLVEPVSQGREVPLPGNADRPPSDWELYMEGRVKSKKAGTAAREDAEWLRAHNWDKLLGAGAWASYDDPPAPAVPGVGQVPHNPQVPPQIPAR